MLIFHPHLWVKSQEDLDFVRSGLDLTPLVQKRIFLTGVTGMIVSTVADMLLRANMVQRLGMELYFAGRSKERVANRFPSCKEGHEYHFVQYDALRPFPGNLPAMDFIIHGAGNADPRHYDAEPVETMMANLDGLHHILQSACRMESKRVLYISSGEVYGNRESTAPFSEQDLGSIDILNPRSCYPSAKRTAETLCAAYAKECDVDTVIVRPCHIYGPSIMATDSRASAQFTRSTARHEDIVMKSDGQTLRSYCYTLDCATAILTVLQKGTRGEAYNIASHKPVTIRQLAGAFAEAGGSKLRFEHPSDREKKSYNMMRHSVLDAQKLEALGWKEHFPFPIGVKKTLAYFAE